MVVKQFVGGVIWVCGCDFRWAEFLSLESSVGAVTLWFSWVCLGADNPADVEAEHTCVNIHLHM